MAEAFWPHVHSTTRNGACGVVSRGTRSGGPTTVLPYQGVVNARESQRHMREMTDAQVKYLLVLAREAEGTRRNPGARRMEMQSDHRTIWTIVAREMIAIVRIRRWW